MRSSVIWSFLSVVALTAGGLLSGCDSDATIAKSGVGESCDSSADCEEGLNCLQGACYKSAPTPDGNAGEGSGGSMVGPTPPVLGGEGESCTKRADCEDGLGCFNQRCTAENMGEGGGGPGGPSLGQLGETCTVSSDCDPSLACLPGGIQPGVPIGYIGVCSRPQGELVPSGKTCGAECLEAADCCELPVALHVAYEPSLAPYGTGANSCAELADLIGTSKCTAAATGLLAARCFAQAAYCTCKDTWECNAGKCNYVASCSADGAVVGGCPSFSRSGLSQVSICDTKDSELCQSPVGKPICQDDGDCEGKATADTGEICTPDECTCYQETGCYRRCDSTLDCRPGYVCDDKTSVCTKAPACSTNAECVGVMGPRYACVDETCQLTCATNYDCNGGGFSGPSTLVCNANGVCEALGCTSDEQCTNGAEVNPVRMFCTEVEGTTLPDVADAITD